MAAANSSTQAVTTTEVHFSSTEYYDTIVVANGTAVAMSVAVDGSTAVNTPGTGNLQVPPNSEVAFDNEAAKGLPNWNSVPNKDMSESYGVTAQTGFTAANSTFCSVIPLGTASGDVTITFQ